MSIHKEDITMKNTPNNSASKYMKQEAKTDRIVGTNRQLEILISYFQ